MKKIISFIISLFFLTLFSNSAFAAGDDENIAATLATQIANLGISDLSDTATTAPSLGDSLVWDGSAWSPGTVIGGATISGTAPTAPEIGEFWFDDTTTGYLYTWDNSSWVQLTGISGGGGATTLTDLGITDGTSGQVLTTDGSAGFTFTSASSSTTLGGVGTYAFLMRTSTAQGSTISVGSSYSGSSLTYAGVSRSAGNNIIISPSGTPSGTWRAMGHVGGAFGGFNQRATSFVRIS